MNKIDLRLGDCLDVLKTFPENSIDAIITDSPYGLSFMNKKWDYDVPSVDVWKECLRVLKPGGHLLSFAGSRTYHRMAVRIEDAGFEIRDQLMWVYASGFPKSHNIGKAIDKISPRLNMFDDFADFLKEKIKSYDGVKSELTNLFLSKNGNKTGCIWNWENGKAVPTKEQYEILKSKLNLSDKFDDLIDRIEKERELVGKDGRTANSSLFPHTINKEWNITKGNGEWEGWGTALKPAHEPIVLARKPLSEKSVAENVLKWGVGGINIDDSRIGELEQGRWPANIIFDEEAGQVLDQQSGISKTTPNHNYKHSNTETDSNTFTSRGTYIPREDKGGASRFFLNVKNENYIWETKQLDVNTVMLNSHLQEVVEDIVVKLVAIRDNQEDMQLKSMIQPFMNEMQIVLKQNSETNIEQMMNTGQKFLQEASHIITEKLNQNPVKYVEIQKLINTTMIIQNLMNIDGFVENITSNIILSNMVLGEQDYPTKFRYCPKASKKDRNEGGISNSHPTVKPTDLMRYLINLITPPNGTILDPFMGSGSTGKAAVRCGVNFIGIEKEQEYMDIAQARINHELNKNE